MGAALLGGPSAGRAALTRTERFFIEDAGFGTLPWCDANPLVIHLEYELTPSFLQVIPVGGPCQERSEVVLGRPGPLLGATGWASGSRLERSSSAERPKGLGAGARRVDDVGDGGPAVEVVVLDLPWRRWTRRGWTAWSRDGWPPGSGRWLTTLPALRQIGFSGTHTGVGPLRARVADRRGRNIGTVAAARRQVEHVYYALRDGHVRALTGRGAA